MDSEVSANLEEEAVGSVVGIRDICDEVSVPGRASACASV